MPPFPLNFPGTPFPSGLIYRKHNLHGRIATLVEHTARPLMNRGLIQRNTSFGLVVANPDYAGRYAEVWDDPSRLIGYAYGWGPEADRYCWNAARKLRAAAREGRDTIDIPEYRFRDIVDSEIETDDPDQRFPWGDYPWPGAAFTGIGDHQRLIGTSALLGIEDHWFSVMFGAFIGCEETKVDEAIAALEAHTAESTDPATQPA